MLETGIKNTTYAGQLHWPLQDTHDAIFPVRCSRCGQNYTQDVLPQNICGKIIKEVLWLNLTWKAHQMTHRCIFSKLKQRKNKKSTLSETLCHGGGNELKDPFCLTEQRLVIVLMVILKGVCLCHITALFTAHLSRSVPSFNSPLCLQQSLKWVQMWWVNLLLCDSSRGKSGSL